MNKNIGLTGLASLIQTNRKKNRKKIMVYWKRIWSFIEKFRQRTELGLCHKL